MAANGVEAKHQSEDMESDGVQEQIDTLQFRDPNQPNFHVVYWTRESAPAPPTDGSRPLTVLFWVHGFGEYVGRVRRKIVGRVLQACGSLDVVMSYDLRGHGQSGGEQGVTDGIAEHISDLREIVLPRMLLNYGPPGGAKRVVIAGHSLGGVITAGLGAREAGDFLAEEELGHLCGFFLSSPAFRIPVHGFVNRILAPFSPLVCRFKAIRARTKHANLPLEHLCHDAKMVEEYRSDPHIHDQLSLGLGADFLAFGDALIESLADPDTPSILKNPTVRTLVTHSPNDQITEFGPSAAFVAAIRNKDADDKDRVSLVEFPGAGHEIFHETKELGCDKYFDALATFLNDIFSS